MAKKKTTQRHAATRGLLVDLHVHCRERSACAESTEEEMVRSAIAFGLDAIAFTDHNRLIPAARAAELSAQYAPFRVFQGIEIGAVEGEEFVVLGIDDPELERPQWPYAELHAFVRAHRGFLILAHPYRYRPDILVDLDRYPPDAIEVSFSVSNQDQIRAICRRTGARPIVNSDGHSAARVGLYYNRLHGTPRTAAGLVKLLRAGKYDLASASDRVDALNVDFTKMENEIHALIAQGRDRDYYKQTTGKMAMIFDRVARGDSFLKPKFPRRH